MKSSPRKSLWNLGRIAVVFAVFSPAPIIVQSASPEVRAVEPAQQGHRGSSNHGRPGEMGSGPAWNAAARDGDSHNGTVSDAHPAVTAVFTEDGWRHRQPSIRSAVNGVQDASLVDPTEKALSTTRVDALRRGGLRKDRARSAAATLAGLGSLAQLRPCQMQRLTVGTRVPNGRSDASDCALPLVFEGADTIYVEQYHFALTARRQLQLDLITAAPFGFVVIVDDQYEQLGYALKVNPDDPTEIARLRQTLPPGDYFALVGDLAGGSMSYGLDTQAVVEGTSNCRVQSLSPGSTVQDMLTANDCRYFDLVPNSLLDFHIAVYSLNVAVPGLMTLRLGSTDFDAVLRVMRSDMTIMYMNDDFDVDTTGTDAALISMPVLAGSYYVLVTTIGSEDLGSFSLESQFVSRSSACRIEAITSGQPQAGTLSPDDCFQMVFNPDFRSPYVNDVYAIAVPQAGELRATLRSIEFGGYIEFFSGTRYQQTGAGTGAEPERAELRRDVMPGTYYIGVSSQLLGEVGAYTVVVEYVPYHQRCPLPLLPIGQPVEDSLGSRARCTYQQMYGSDYLDHMDIYAIGPHARGHLTLRITTFDSALRLLVFDRTTSWNYWLPTDTNSTSEMTLLLLPDRDYQLAVVDDNEFQSRARYRLDASFSPRSTRTCESVRLQSNETVRTTLGLPDCEYIDEHSLGGEQTFIDRYEIHLDERSRIDLELTPDVVPMSLRIMTRDRQSLLEERDNPGLDTVNIDGVFLAGDYTIEVGSHYVLQSGPYALTARVIPRPLRHSCVIQDAFTNLDANVAGELNNDDCMPIDFYPDNRHEALGADLFRMIVPQRGALLIDMISPSPEVDDDNVIDPVLYLYDSRGEIIQGNDDYDFGDPDQSTRNAHLGKTLKPGIYYVMATSWDSDYGPYTLQMRFRPRLAIAEVYLPLNIRLGSIKSGNRNSIVNGAFESGSLDPGWTDFGEIQRSVESVVMTEVGVALESPLEGRFAALLGDPRLGAGLPDEDGKGHLPVGAASIVQDVGVPITASPRLQFAYRIITYDVMRDGKGRFYDLFEVAVRPPDGHEVRVFADGNTSTGSSQSVHDLGWRSATVDLAAWRGQAIRIRFTNWNGIDRKAPAADSNNTWTYVDGVTLMDE